MLSSLVFGLAAELRVVDPVAGGVPSEEQAATADQAGQGGAGEDCRTSCRASD